MARRPGGTTAVAALVVGAGLVGGCGGTAAPEGNLPPPKSITVEESRKLQEDAEAKLGRMLVPGPKKAGPPGAVPKAR